MTMREAYTLLECLYCGKTRTVTASYVKWVNPKSIKCHSCGDRNIKIRQLEPVDFYPESNKEDKDNV